MWKDYSKEKPQEEGVYEWLIPSKSVDGLTLVVVARMRNRLAASDRVLSPEFDYWDGYNVIVDCDVKWRECEVDNYGGIEIVGIEGLEISECLYCGNVPSVNASQKSNHGHGIVIGAKPWNYNLFRFECCEWGTTIFLDNPFDIEDKRQGARSAARGGLPEQRQEPYGWMVVGTNGSHGGVYTEASGARDVAADMYEVPTLYESGEEFEVVPIYLKP